MSPSLPSRSTRRFSSPYPTRLHRAIRPRVPDLSSFSSRENLSNEGPSFLGTQGQPIELDNPLLEAAFRPLDSLPAFHEFNPSPAPPVLANHDHDGHEPATPNQSACAQPRELASPMYRDSPPSYHRDDSPVYRPMSPLFLPSPPPLAGIPVAEDEAPVSGFWSYFRVIMMSMSSAD